MTYTTLTYAGVEKSLADWGGSSWSRTVQNQANDEFSFTVQTPMDGNDIFPYGANIIVKINRIASALNPRNPTLPNSLALTPSLTYSGGTQWFWGYCIDNDRHGDPGAESGGDAGAESFNYKFVGPWQFFFERLIFQKLQLTWNGVKQICDYQSDVILGLSLTVLTGPGDNVTGTTATNLMTIAQQIKEICMYAQADSAYQQSTNGLSWPGTSQFQCDALTATVDSINWDLLQTPSANVLIKDYAGTALSGKTSASVLSAGSYMLRCPLDAVNAITCTEAMRRQLQWIGGIGNPVVWTDHSQTPPQLHVATRDQLGTKSLALAGITIKNKIKIRADLIPAAVHFKYKVAGTYLGQPYSVVVNDVVCYVGGTLYEGIGQLGALTNLSNAALSSGIQADLMAAAKTAGSIVQTLDFQGDQVNAASCKITTQALNLVDPAGTGADGGFWAGLFPELNNVTGLAFYNAGSPGVTIVDATSGASYYASGAWTGTAYVNRVTDGQVAPWMLASTSTPANPVGGKTVKATLTVRFAYQEQAQGASAVNSAKVAYHEKNITVTLTTLSSGTYYSSPSVSSGEPIPYGLAGYILALETMPQYEGSILVQETEITDVCPLGNALNITGGLTAWSTMAAQVQSVRYSNDGQTEITFGPAKHLGPAEFVARFRNNVGPRWYLLIVTDPMNQANPGATQLGNNIPAQAPSPGNKNFSFQSFFANLPGEQTSPDSSGLSQGAHIDSGAAPSPISGFPQSAAFIVAKQGGAANSWARLCAADIQDINTQQILIREFPICFDFGDGLGVVPAYAQFVMSYPYHTAGGGT